MVVVACAATLSLMTGALAACSSSGSSKAKQTSAQTAQARAARARIAAAQRRLATARRQVAAQRRALTAAIQRENRREQLARATTTTVPSTVPGATVPVTTVPASGPGTAVADAAAIGRRLETLNAAFSRSVAAGIAASEAANYYIFAGVYTNAQCASFEASRGLGVVSDHLAVRGGTIAATPGWVDPLLHATPRGRLYSLVMDDVQTQIATGAQRSQTISTHATVLANGRAMLFLRCA